MKDRLKQISLLKYAVILGRAIFIKPNLLTRMRRLSSYFADYKKYRKLEKNPAYKLETEDLFPRIHDNTENTDIDPVYYIQGVWCARKVFDNKPAKHCDIGSQALMVGIISQFAPTTMVDIRPFTVSLPELSFVKGDITRLPFADDSVESLSSICVIEHIGLGRYGDPLDPFGTEKSTRELSRVLARGGNLYISVPVDKENKTYFNAHRAFTRDYVLELFRGLRLVEEKYIYGRKTFDSYDPQIFGTGLFHFRK